jgi:hypothetical protein
MVGSCQKCIEKGQKRNGVNLGNVEKGKQRNVVVSTLRMLNKLSAKSTAMMMLGMNLQIVWII